ncbi:MAG: hypothetical protein IH892_08775, partial [Planctomycetes bacterium]|nr:hypothetical protein [Planctomycetota bacterium]
MVCLWGGPAVILRFAAVAVNMFIVNHQQPSARGVSAGLKPLAGAGRNALAVGPVAAVEIGIVEESDAAEKMHAFALLFGDIGGFQEQSFPVQVHALSPHIKVFPVAGKHVRQAGGHVQALGEHRRFVGLAVMVGVLQDDDLVVGQVPGKDM